jgi:large subunit ribosomal protein L32e
MTRKRFLRQEWFRYKRLGKAWRRPKGMHSKLREHRRYRMKVVSIGYGTPRSGRGLHPSGLREIMVSNMRELEDIDSRVEAARISASVGLRKRVEIETAAAEKSIRVLNPSKEVERVREERKREEKEKAEKEKAEKEKKEKEKKEKKVAAEKGKETKKAVKGKETKKAVKGKETKKAVKGKEKGA